MSDPDTEMLSWQTPLDRQLREQVLTKLAFLNSFLFYGSDTATTPRFFREE
jgi:hypothetical protein